MGRYTHRITGLIPDSPFLTALLDARTLAPDTLLETDLAIIGGGPAGISLALSLAGSKIRVLLMESGGMNFDPTIQKM